MIKGLRSMLKALRAIIVDTRNTKIDIFIGVFLHNTVHPPYRLIGIIQLTRATEEHN